MLQIGSGRLFADGVARRNELRGVLFTNLFVVGEKPIETVAGRLLPTNTLKSARPLVYEFSELIEGNKAAPGIIFSHGIDPYIHDFSAIISFFLNVICTPDAELSARLTSGKRSISLSVPPGKLVKRVFDERVILNVKDSNELVSFVDALLGLPRKTYLGVMRAIRNYVTGIHRLADDAELSYTLFVASIESLAQSFDGHKASWNDYEERKRLVIDRALEGAEGEVAERVRGALLDLEHVSLGRRFQAFALQHIEPSFFREDAVGLDYPIGRTDLSNALKEAYSIRSKYVHNLEELPVLLTLGHSYTETMQIGRATVLTFQGLTRVAHHAIKNFVFRQPHLTAEPYDYGLERSGVVQMSLAAQYWIGQPIGRDPSEGLNAKDGLRRLEGLLGQISAIEEGIENSAITDLRDFLDEAEKLFPTSKKSDRLPFLVTYFLFYSLVPGGIKKHNYDGMWQRYHAEVEAPSVEVALACLIQSAEMVCPLEKHEEVRKQYFRRRDRENGIRVSRSLEAGLTLELAERYRRSGDVRRAKALIVEVVEEYPGSEPLRDLEKKFDGLGSIDWRDILFKKPGSLI